MKKTILLLATGLLAFSSQAQESRSVMFSSSTSLEAARPRNALTVEQMDRMHNMPYCKNNNITGARTTSLNSDWYDLWDQNYTSGTSLGYYSETFPDSNLYDATNSSHIFDHGMGQSFDPTDSGYFSMTFNVFGGAPTLVASVASPMPPTNSSFPLANPTYILDSIYVPVTYIRHDATSVDTLVIEITEAVNQTAIDTGTYNLEYPSSAGVTWWSADHTPRFGTVHYNAGTIALPAAPAPYNTLPYSNDCNLDTVFMTKQRYEFVLPSTNAEFAADTDANGNLLLSTLVCASATTGGGVGTASTTMTPSFTYPIAGLYSLPLFSPMNINTQTGMNPHPVTFVTMKSGHTGGTYPLGTNITAANWIKLYEGGPAGNSYIFQQASSNAGLYYDGSYQAALYCTNQIRYNNAGFTFNGHNVLLGSTAYPNGTYTYELAVAEGGFHITWNPTTATGIKNINTLNNISVYPNPANSALNITFSAVQNADATVSLTNMLGQVVATQHTTTGTTVFNTSALPTGMYIYTIQSNGIRSTGHVEVAH